jgi:hypothetical protein
MERGITGMAQGSMYGDGIGGNATLQVVSDMLKRHEMKTMEKLAELAQRIEEIQPSDQNQRYEPTHLDKISMYLQLLYDAQKVDHNVHDEITEALKVFRKEAGI